MSPVPSAHGSQGTLSPRAQPGVSAEMWVRPSREAEFLVRRLAWLVSPADGRGSPLSRLLRMVLVAPFTQLTFLSFELQAFLFGVFHRTAIARAGHFVGMLVVVAAGLAWLALHGLHWPAAGLLLVWYAAIARDARLWLWWLVMVPIVLILAAAAQLWAGALVPAAATGSATWAAPWRWLVLAAAAIMLSHATEPFMPPRVVSGPRWRRLAEFLLGSRAQRNSMGTMARRLLRVALYLVWGTLDEAWASPRLLPYNVLMLLFRGGCARERAAELLERVDRALAAGNPALDYVGIGGDTLLGAAKEEVPVP